MPLCQIILMRYTTCMHIPFNKTQKIHVPEATIWDYDISEHIGISYQELSIRGPQEGYYLNKKCHEIYFIIAGSATFHVGDNSFIAEAKDVVVVPENTPHAIETDHLTYITITRPDWFEEQAEVVF